MVSSHRVIHTQRVRLDVLSYLGHRQFYCRFDSCRDKDRSRIVPGHRCPQRWLLHCPTLSACPCCQSHVCYHDVHQRLPLDPISLSVLSTNVYEKQSLGNFPSNDDDEENSRPIGSRVPIWSRYLGLHARRQLSSDMWWLSLGLFLICIIERHNLDNPNIQGKTIRSLGRCGRSRSWWSLLSCYSDAIVDSR
ncbi:hypothetical protein EV401DRAFT_439498 [Pisolithus croceorrhizus]|nr:hypothetical protein EV401DRAFT_439498 [Pisolithus croceorrhizus]